MNITILGPSYPYRGGIVHFNTRLITELRKNKKNKIQVITWKRLYPTFFLPKPEKEFMDSKSKEKFLIDEEKRLLDYLNPFSWIRLVLLIKKSKSKVFITHWQQPIHFPIYVIIFLLIKILSKTKIVLIAHNVQIHENSGISNMMTKIIFLCVDRIITHSKPDYNLARKLVPRKEVIHAYHPIYSIFTKQPTNIKKLKKEMGLDKKVLLFFGFIRPYKGLEYLIEAVRILKDEIPDLNVIIAGELFWKVSKDTNFFQKIKRLPFKILKTITIRKSNVDTYNPFTLIQKYDLGNQIKIYDNYIPNEEVYKFYIVSDALVAPYISATQSGPIQIAYHFNRPVLASRVGGLVEAVEDGISGFLFKPKDQKSLAKTIKRFYKTKNNWEESVRVYKERFNWNNYSRKLIQNIS